MEFNTLLVPVDFSTSSRIAFEEALKLASGDEPTVIILYVVDTSFVEFASSHGMGTMADIAEQLHQHADTELKALAAEHAHGVSVEIIVAEGAPFLEIAKKAEEFQVDAIVLGTLGAREELSKLLFAATAERVLRASTRPVIVLPITG